MNLWPEICRSTLRPLKRACVLNPETLPESTDPDFEFEYIDIGSVTLEAGISAREPMTFESAPSRARKPVRAGDVIVSTVRTYLKAVASIGLNADRWIVSTGFSVLRSGSKVDPRFLYRVVQSNPFVEGVVAASTGVSYPAINPSTLGNIPIPCPDLLTQKTIADFLDRETSRIDQLIEKKQRLVELLSEKDKATVKLHVLGQFGERDRAPNEAVWLPDLPSEWPIQRCAHIFRNLDSKRIPLNSEQRADLEKIYPYYGASGVIDYVDRYIFDSDNILVGEDGANLVMQSTPIAFRASGKYWVNNHAHIIHPRFGILDYWVHALNQVPYEVFVTGSAQPKLTSEALGNIRLPCPPSSEQADIVNRLERERQALVALRDPISRSIDGLKEFRSALITAAVTGQIDVSKWGQRGEPDRRLDAIQREMAS